MVPYFIPNPYSRTQKIFWVPLFVQSKKNYIRYIKLPKEIYSLDFKPPNKLKYYGDVCKWLSVRFLQEFADPHDWENIIDST